jgi:hypothetical protein
VRAATDSDAVADDHSDRGGLAVSHAPSDGHAEPGSHTDPVAAGDPDVSSCDGNADVDAAADCG